MTNTEGITWIKVLGANDWIAGNGYYFKVTDGSANITFIGYGSTSTPMKRTPVQIHILMVGEPAYREIETLHVIK